jgi:hypothetical protein
MPIITDPRDTASALVGEVDARFFDAPQVEAERPGLLDTLAAASRQATIAGSAYERIVNHNPDDTDPVPDGFDPLDGIAGYEDYADDFADLRSPGEVAGLKSRIQEERGDREVLARAGLGGVAPTIAMNLLDPSFLVAAAVPELALSKLIRIQRSLNAAARGGAGAVAYETAMQNLQETRSPWESAINIGAGSLIGGVLGSLGKVVPKREMNKVDSAVREAIRSESGAASVRRPTTLQAESFAAGGKQLSEIASRIPFAQTDLQKVFASESIEARTLLQEIAEVSPLLSKNLDGFATPAAVESALLRHEGAVADFAIEMKKAWKQYKGRDLPEGERRLTRRQFEEAVAGASRRNDYDVVPEVSKAAGVLRSRVFEPLKNEAQRLKLLPADADINLFAASYFTRMYDRGQIRLRRGEWDNLLERHYLGKGLDEGEAKTVADDVTRRILGMDRGLANFHVMGNVKNAGPLHERVLDIPDEQIEGFLVNDPVRVASSYARELGAQVEFTKRFGDKDLKDSLQRVKDEYAILRGRSAGDAKRIKKLDKEQTESIEAITRIRDRLYGRAGDAPQTIGGQRAVDFVRGWRNLVAAAKLGGTALTGGVQDLSRIVGTYGFLPTARQLTRLIAKPEFRELSRANARRLGVATEVALARRAQVAADGAITEGWTEKLANTTYKISGLNHVTDLWRTLAATLVEDKVLTTAAKVASGTNISKALRAEMARLGLDEDALKGIAVQVEKHGAEVDGLQTSGSMQWTDGPLAEVYDSAIAKEARSNVMVPGAADRVWWADGEIGKTLGQIKSFALAAPTKLTMAPVQMLGQRRYAAAARLTGALFVGGYLSHAFRQLAAGKLPETDPVKAAGEAASESGLGGVTMDLVSPIARRFGVLGESARYSDRNVAGAYGGPAVGFMADLYDIGMNRTQGGLSASDLQAIRRNLPMQNLWYLRRAINALQGEIAEGMDLKGADSDTFMRRLTRTEAMTPTGKRGATGTGQMVQ